MRKRKSSTYSSEQINYTADIIKEVLKRKKFSFGQKRSEEVMRILFDYMSYQSKQPDVFAFEIPHLGYMYKPTNFLINSKKYFDVGSEQYEKILEEIQQLKRFGDEFGYKKPHSKRTLVAEYEKVISNMYEITDVQRSMDKPSLQILSAIEDKQTRDYKNNK